MKKTADPQKIIDKLQQIEAVELLKKHRFMQSNAFAIDFLGCKSNIDILSMVAPKEHQKYRPCLKLAVRILPILQDVVKQFIETKQSDNRAFSTPKGVYTFRGRDVNHWKQKAKKLKKEELNHGNKN